MIVKWALQFFIDRVADLVGLLPNFSVPNIHSQVSSLNSLWSLFGWANQYLPIDAAVAMVSLLLVGWAALQALHIAVWVATKAHILGGSS